MSSIPLPALAVNPPQQQDTLGNYEKILQLRQMQQEAPLRQQALQQQVQSGQLQLQQQQRAMQDQQAMTKAMQQWDGKSLDALPPLVLKNGGSANAVMGLKQKALAMQQQYSTIAKDDAATGASNLVQQKQKNDMLAGALSNLEQVPDAQLPQAIQSTANDLVQRGLLDPQHAQMAQQLAQLGDPTKMRQQLDVLRKSYMSQSQMMDEAQKNVQMGLQQAQTKVAQMTAEQGGTSDSAKYVQNYLQANGLQPTPENRLKAFNDYIQKTRIQPAQVRMEGYAQTREYPVFDKKLGQTVYMSAAEINNAKQEDPGRFTAASYTPESLGAKAATNYFVSGKGGQQLTAFNTAMQHLDVLNGLASDLNNSNIQVFNRAAQAWATQTGNPTPASFDAAKNAMAGEVAAALKASGATDQEIEKVDNTFSKIQSPVQLKGAISTYKSLLRSKAYNLKMQYEQGMQGKPNFEPDNAPATPSSAPSSGQVIRYKIVNGQLVPE